MTRRARPERKRDLQGLLGQDVPDLSKPALADQQLALTLLKPGRSQPRREFNQAALESLAASLREKGVLQPLLVRPVGQEFEIVAGERRWRAAQLAGLESVPVIVRELSDNEARQLALIENLQREDLNTVDEVDAKLELVAATLNLPRDEVRGRLMQLLREETGPDHAALEQVFASLGEQWTSFARNKVKILNWPPAILDAVRSGLPYSLAQLIVPTDAKYHARFLKLAREGISRADLRAEIRRVTEQQAEQPQAKQVAKVLSSNRWYSRLNTTEQRAVQQWLEKMPRVVKDALKD